MPPSISGNESNLACNMVGTITASAGSPGAIDTETSVYFGSANVSEEACKALVDICFGTFADILDCVVVVNASLAASG